ncbi:hypothetical protein ASPZODRAFT_133842 [Penicilliopsis zonata CBS 506.65]|uniref:Rhodopsin domain-containing protein n=1 Tax=Penicilliopsis zonata CBS 506.65 TaxID=1073090 RepID=A0A1L9SDR1_9EURO|nr:hypothetical protein ASPZODRAFT_133842 [Penicilliopsis zonata CBS 506.65]OJJ45217.1 hypothetical protein ASPZODRAFT_133842 [Penicilliopsis zonata CBS 506.65]
MSTAYAAESNLPTILGVLTTFFFLSIIVVGLRIYSRVVIARAPGIDDGLIILAAICQLGQWIVILIQSRHGLGRHESTISAAELIIYNHASFVGNIVGIAIGTMFLKLSIAANLLRLCQQRWFTLALWVLVVIIIAYEMVGTLFFFLVCRPMSGSWDPYAGAKCSSTETIVIFGLVNTSFNIITDVALAILPIPIIWRLNMKKSVRLYLVGILSLGYLAVAMDIVKTYYQETYTVETDETYTFSLIFYGFLEDCIGMTAASVPMLKPLVGRVLGLNSTRDTYYPHGSNSNTPWSQGRSQHNASASASGGMRSHGGRPGGGKRAPPDMYELDERETDSDEGASTQSKAFPYRHEPGSEENILQDSANSNARRLGITKTTEVRVV